MLDDPRAIAPRTCMSVRVIALADDYVLMADEEKQWLLRVRMSGVAVGDTYEIMFLHQRPTNN